MSDSDVTAEQEQARQQRIAKAKVADYRSLRLTVLRVALKRLQLAAQHSGEMLFVVGCLQLLM